MAWLGFKLKIDAFALPFIGIGVALKLTGEGSRRGALGMAVAGFGLLFLGIDMLKQGFEGLGPQALPSLSGDAAGVALSVLVGGGCSPSCCRPPRPHWPWRSQPWVGA